MFPHTVGIMDMFSHTTEIHSSVLGYVETVCLLSKLKVRHHIEVELNLDELDLPAAERKATYAEIKDYVLEHSGLRVGKLYIAQIK